MKKNKCIICKRMLRRKTKYEMCSNCYSINLGTLMKKKIIYLEDLKKIIHPIGKDCKLNDILTRKEE